MSTSYSKLSVACALASSFVLAACSDAETQKKNTTLTASAPITSEAPNLTERNAQQRLTQRLQENLKLANIDAKILDIKTTEVPQMYWVTLENMGSVFVSADAKYVFQGELVRLGGNKIYNITENLQAVEVKKQLDQLKAEDLIIYEAKGKTKHIIYVFTDVSCPYCHKFHEHMNEFNAKGIEVRYIAWPRGDQLMPAMEAVWCSADRKAAFDKAIAQTEAASEVNLTAPCKNPVREQYQLGLNIGVNGTPAIYNENGLYLGGYLSPNDLMKHLDN